MKVNIIIALLLISSVAVSHARFRNKPRVHRISNNQDSNNDHDHSTTTHDNSHDSSTSHDTHNGDFHGTNNNVGNFGHPNNNKFANNYNYGTTNTYGAANSGNIIYGNANNNHANSGNIIYGNENNNHATSGNIVYNNDNKNPASTNGKQVADGIYAIFANSNGRCFDIKDQSTNDNAELSTWEYWAGSNEQFIIARTSNGYYTITSVNSGKLLSSVSDGDTRLVQLPANGRTNQEWNIVREARGAYSFQSRSSGKYITSHGTKEDPHNILQSTRDTNAPQTFSLLSIGHTRANPLKSGNYVIVSSNKGMVLDLNGVNSDDNAFLNVFSYWGGKNQQFNVQSVDETYYTIVALHSNKALTVPNDSTNDGETIVQLTLTNAENQQWRFDQQADGTFKIINRVSNMGLEAPENGGERLPQKDLSHNSDRQNFAFMAI